MSSPILIYGGGSPPAASISNPPVYSQTGTTALVEGQAYIDVVFGSIQTTEDWVLATCEVENTVDFEPLNIWPGIITDRTAAGFRLQLNGLPDSGNYYLHWAVSGVNIASSPASTYYLSAVGTTITVRLPASTTVSGPLTITPHDGGAGGSFSPATVALTTTSASATFIYTPAGYGDVTISTTNSGTLSDPAGIVITVVVPTYTLTGPSGGVAGVASTNFTVTLPAGVVGTVVVTMHDGGGGGTFAPTTLSLVASGSGTFTYTPASGGAKTISVTNDTGLADPANLTYTATVVATGYSLSGPSSGVVSVASTDFTVTLTPAGGTVAGTITITPSDGGGGGAFTPTTVGLTTAAPSTTFIYTPASTGAKTISVTNSGTLTNPGNLTYTVTAAAHLLNTLISYWKLDEASGTRNDSQGTNHVAPAGTGAVTAVSGKISNGISCAASAFLGIGNNSTLQVTSDFTFSCWAQISSTTGTNFILGKVDFAGNNDYFLNHDATNGWQGVTANNTVVVNVAAPATLNTWYHLVFWYDHLDSKMRLRVNDTTTYVSAATGALTQTTVGFGLGGTTAAAGGSLTGPLDEVGFWKRILTAGEITALYNAGAGLPFSSFTT